VQLLLYLSISDLKISILDCKISLADSAARFGAVYSATITIEGLLKKAILQASKLYNPITEDFVVTLRLDYKSSIKDIPI
jgi:hypothetical protein